MDQTTRNLLQRATQDARRLLEAEFAAQLEGTYDILPDGSILPEPGPHLDGRQRLIRRKLVETIAHARTKEAGKTNAEAIGDYLREAAFTFLNRLAALKMLEARGLVQQCVSNGDQSSGFKEFCGLAPGLGSLADKGYQLYLECLFDELGTEVRVLFDRTDAASLLWPRRTALVELLGILSREALQDVWAEDETIGWIYQYYNDEAERKKMREQSSAPRNSRELAVRNQFFTPRYVVEFLTDNTLGRIWYEMTKGRTALRERCRYLVRRPDEVFLEGADSDAVRVAQEWLQTGEGEQPELWSLAHAVNGYLRAGTAGEESNRWVEERLPRLKPEAIQELKTQELLDLLFLFCRKERFCEGTIDSLREEIDFILSVVQDRVAKARRTDLSQEELLRLPVFIPHRPLKDPREIRLLDPACGSMHFGLYAFDLFAAIYNEAWEIAQAENNAIKPGEGFEPFVAFAATFPDKGAFLHEVPRLIVEQNLHGIDIDPRAVQIANLSLWLRAQRAWHQDGVKTSERPRIRRSNVVCAEPMPGEKNLLREFIERQFPAHERPVFTLLLEKIFDRMALAGEAGSLLRIEEEIRNAIAEAHALARRQPAARQLHLFAGNEPPEQAELDFRELNDDQFWQAAEQRIYDSLEAYAEQAANGGGFRRRLFAEDAAQGFAFIDLCRKRYDVVVMNPPFGEASLQSRNYLYTRYTHATQDVFSAFVDRGLNMLDDGGSVGAITSRLAFYLELLEEWRVRLFDGSTQLSVMADLGYGVLDAALVEAAAYVISNTKRNSSTAAFLSLLAREDKGGVLLENCLAIRNGEQINDCFIVNPVSFVSVPASRAAYWVSQFWRDLFRSNRTIESTYGFPFVGLQTGDDGFFLRLAWESPPQEIGGSEAHWVSFAKGGEYAQFFGDFHLLVNWACRALARRQSNANGYFKTGITFTERTTSNLSARLLPPDCVFSPNGVTIVVSKQSEGLECAALLNSSVSQLMIELCVGGGDAVYSGSAARHYGPRIVGRVPAPGLTEDQSRAVSTATLKIWNHFQEQDAAQETGRYFVSPFFRAAVSLESIASLAEYRQRLWEDRVLAIITEHDAIECIFVNAYGIDGSNMEELTRETGVHPNRLAGCTPPADEFRKAYLASVDVLIDAAVRMSGASRTLTKKTYIADRKLELLAHRFGVHPRNVIQCRRGIQLLSNEQCRSTAEDVISFFFGVAFGRWDIRYATGERPAPELPGPFAPLPVCPPGMLQGDDGLPLSPDEGRRLRAEGHYPLDVAWDGILVDDPEHPLDIVRRVHDALTVIWGERVDAIQQEACDLLGVPSLREWFRCPAGFFADHLKRYSKSRRQAPIYWPLSTMSGSYTIWLYYHRFRRDTLALALEEAKGKLRYEQKKLESLRGEVGPSPTRTQRDEIESQETKVGEVSGFVEELSRVAPLWKPNLNDGVIINYAPLWRMIGHTPWRKSVKSCWDSLVAGDYDWAHLAMHLWPERVVPKCQEDASLAIAHGLDEVFWAKDDRDRLVRKGPPEGGWEPVIEPLVAERSIPAVKAALQNLLESPPLAGAGGGRRSPGRSSSPRRLSSGRSPSDTESTGAARRSKTPGTAPDGETLELVKSAIGNASDGASKAEVLAVTGLSDSRWNTVITTLIEQGVVLRTGERRATRYHLAQERSSTQTDLADGDLMEGQV